MTRNRKLSQAPQPAAVAEINHRLLPHLFMASFALSESQEHLDAICDIIEPLAPTTALRSKSLSRKRKATP